MTAGNWDPDRLARTGSDINEDVLDGRPLNLQSGDALAADPRNEEPSIRAGPYRRNDRRLRLMIELIRTK